MAAQKQVAIDKTKKEQVDKAVEVALKKAANKMIYIGKPIEFDDDVFKKQLDKIYKDAYDETDNIREDIKEIVPTYQGVK